MRYREKPGKSSEPLYRLPGVFVEAAGGHQCRCNACSPSFSSDLRSKLIRNIHHEKQAELTEAKKLGCQIWHCQNSSDYHRGISSNLNQHGSSDQESHHDFKHYSNNDSPEDLGYSQCLKRIRRWDLYVESSNIQRRVRNLNGQIKLVRKDAMKQNEPVYRLSFDLF